jgi:predicted HTH domain antitoxin
MQTLTITLPEETELSEVKMIIAASLFEKGILSSRQATELVGISRRSFLEELGKYGISIFGETIEDIGKLTDLEL